MSPVGAASPGLEATGGLDALAAAPGPLHEELAWLVHGLEWASLAVDLMAILIALIGVLRFALAFLSAETERESATRIRVIERQRMELGRYILASLEVLIVSDIIHTALTFSLGDLMFLGLLVLIRSLISFFLDRELKEIREELRSGDP
ncbi:MAG: DUF1622 domain-containing protein [Amaricoccus sp.]